VGHPFFDDLDQRPLDTDFVSKAHAAPGSPRLLLLPGSRRAEAEHNASLLCRSAAKLRRLVPGTRVDIAAFNEPIAKIVRRSASQCQLPVDIHVGRARELMSLADAAVSVSGSVSMELLHHAVPTAVVYSVGWFWKSVFLPLALETPYITLVNLLAGRPLFPEYVGPQDFSAEIAKSVAPWLADPARRQAIRGQLLHLKKIYAHPGASDRAALAIEEYLSAGSKKYRKSA
jgi:lipid-A-disaccharide synthase